MTYSEKLKYFLSMTFVALGLAFIFSQDFVAQHVWAPDDRVAVPMQSSRTRMSDNYYYYIVSKKAPLKLDFWSEANGEQPFFYKNSGLENIYSGALLVAGLLDAGAKLVPVEWNMQVVLSLVAQLSFLILALSFVYRGMRGGGKIPLAQVFVFALLWALLARGVIYGAFLGSLDYLFNTSPFYHPDFMRLVNPQISWAFSLFYLTLLISYFDEGSCSKYVVLVVLSLLFGTFSVSLTVAVGLGLGLQGAMILLKEKRLDWTLFGLVLALLISFIYTRYQFQLFFSSIKGEELSTGEFIGLNINPNYLVLLIFIPLFRKFLPSALKSPLTWIFVASLFMGVVGESFKLGARIWLRGTSVFVHLLIVFALFESIRLLLVKTWKPELSTKVVFPVLFLASGGLVYAALQVSYSGWYGYIERDKAEVISWFRENAGRSHVIASADLEDAYLLPLYTHSQPYVQLFDFSVLNYEQRLDRYFQVLDFTSQTVLRMEGIKQYHIGSRREMINSVAARSDTRVDYDSYQAYAFYSALIYYPYSRRVEDVFSSEEMHQEFIASLESVASQAKASAAEEVDFWIVRNDPRAIPPSGYKLEFENTRYRVLSAVTMELTEVVVMPLSVP